jgi:hypothetical protein
LTRLDQKEFRAAFLRHQFAAFRAGFRVAHHVPARARYFESSSALMILCALLLTAGENFGPADCLVSISDLSRRFFVSRAHVRNLLRSAENDGFIERQSDGPERIAVLPRLGQVLAMSTGRATRCAPGRPRGRRLHAMVIRGLAIQTLERRLFAWNLGIPTPKACLKVADGRSDEYPSMIRLTSTPAKAFERKTASCAFREQSPCSL